MSSQTQVRRGPMTNQARRQSRGPDGRPAQPLQGKMNEKQLLLIALQPGIPSSAASTADRVRATKSLFAQVSNRLLQQNLPLAIRAAANIIPKLAELIEMDPKRLVRLLAATVQAELFSSTYSSIFFRTLGGIFVDDRVRLTTLAEGPALVTIKKDPERCFAIIREQRLALRSYQNRLKLKRHVSPQALKSVLLSASVSQAHHCQAAPLHAWLRFILKQASALGVEQASTKPAHRNSSEL